jgi:hypothetical protein
MRSFNRFNSSNNRTNTNYFISKQVIEERNKKQKEDEFIKSLDNSDAFPELKNKNTNCEIINNDKNQSTSFIDAMKTKNIKMDNSETINNDAHNYIPPGCVCIQYDKSIKKTVWIYGTDTKPISEKNSMEEAPYFVLKRLVDLQQNRKYDYIRKWGIDEYDKMFMFQNYDYEYFDKLDHQITNDMEKYYQNNTYNYNDFSDLEIASDTDN